MVVRIILVALSVGMLALLLSTPKTSIVYSDEWVPYVPSAYQVSFSYWRDGGNMSHVCVSVDLPDTGTEVVDWGTSSTLGHYISVDTIMYHWTGVVAPVITTVSHTYHLGNLPCGSYTFDFKAWGIPVKSFFFNVYGSVIVVPDYYPTIQDAINNAQDGITVFVKAGTYHEHVVINKCVSLVGQNHTTTIIDGMNTGTVLNLKAGNANVTGFTVRNSGNESLTTIDSGILIQSSNNRIESNIITNNTGGIYVNRSTNELLTSNYIYNNCYGIVLDNSHGNTLQSNIVVSNANVDIGLNGSNANTFSLNNVSSSHFGICMSNSTDNVISANSINENDYGVRLEQESNNNTLQKNSINNNSLSAIMLDSSNDSRIVNNAFINNTNQADLHETYNNRWADGYPAGGNYWDDYTGNDLFKGPYQNETGHDGIGDTPYVLDPNTQDAYPLMGLLDVDVNHDGRVDIKDIYIMAKAYGTTCTDGQYCHSPQCPSCPHDPRLDINRDGKIDLKDYYRVCKNYGKTYP